MRYAVVFTSKTGNTRHLAEEIRKQLGEEECGYFGAPDAAALEADVVFAGFWTDRGSCDGEMAAFLESLSNQQLFLFGTAGFGGDPAYFEKILETVKSHVAATVSVIGTYMCQGQMPLAVRRRYEAMEDGARKERMVTNFDRAVGHPDAADLQALWTSVSRTLARESQK